MTYQPQSGDQEFAAVSSNGSVTLPTGYLSAGGAWMPTAGPLIYGQDPEGNPTVVSTDNSGNVNVNVVSGGGGTSATVTLAAGSTVADTNSAAYQGMALFTGSNGTLTATAGRGVAYECTASGTATMTFPDGSSIPVPIQAGNAIQSVPYAINKIVLSAGTAGTFWSAK